MSGCGLDAFTRSPLVDPLSGVAPEMTTFQRLLLVTALHPAFALPAAWRLAAGALGLALPATALPLPLAPPLPDAPSTPTATAAGFEVDQRV